MPEARPLRRAAFLDRDGTICEEMGYVNHVDRMRIFPFAAEAIRQLNEAHIPVIVVTNQSGVARDIFPESLVHQVHKKLISELAAGGAPRARSRCFLGCGRPLRGPRDGARGGGARNPGDDRIRAGGI